jgi:hypothetical protein
MMIGAIILRGINTSLSHQEHNKAPLGHQLQEAEEEEALVEGSAPNQEGCFIYITPGFEGKPNVNHVRAKIRNSRTHRLHK